MLKKLLYVGHSYHLKTKSTAFLIDFLKEFYDVNTIVDETWNGGKCIDTDIYNDYEKIVFFQYIPPRVVLDKIPTNDITFIPMYDAYQGHNFSFWRQYKKLKIINFSNTLHIKLKNWGFNSMYIQYFPNPNSFLPGNIAEVFFWQRINSVNINVVKILLENYDCSIHIHKAIDPFHKFVEPSKEDEEKYKITYSDWFESKEEMYDIMKNRAIYIAPREYEGWGTAFLEAMAMGKCVIANNKPTMNEYIQDKVTGYLFDINNPKPIDLYDIEKIQKNAYEYIKIGRENWDKNKIEIINFIEKNKKNKLLALEVRCLINVVNVCINKLLQFFLKIQFHKQKGNYIRVFGIYIYDTRKTKENKYGL